jgi:hypothetical protein
VIGVALTAAALAGNLPATDPAARARQFLDAFAAQPANTKQFFTNDATIVVGDIGGPSARFLPLFETAGSWMKTCRVESIGSEPGPSADDLKDAPATYRDGKLSVFEGAYGCVPADKPKFDYKFHVVLQNDRVLMLQLGEGPK